MNITNEIKQSTAVKELEKLVSQKSPRPLKIGKHTARLPIIQGGMAVGISLSGLASAVAENGGIGVIAAPGIGMFEPDFVKDPVNTEMRCLEREIKKARELTQGVIGVNIMVAQTDYDLTVKTAVDAGIDIIFSGAGLPLNLPQIVGDNKHVSLVPIISSARAARIICTKWLKNYNRLPDGFVVEGPLAGGHLGFKKEDLDLPQNRLENLVSEVISEVKTYEKENGVKIPVIAAGGIYSGADIFKFLKLGASGVQMGTRFVATDECDAASAFKEAYVNAKEEDITIIKSPVGMPGRAISNKYTESVAAGEKKPFKCPYQCVRTCDYKESPFCIFIALRNAQRGKLSGGFAFCGANVYKVNRIIPVKKLFALLLSEYRGAFLDELVSNLVKNLNNAITTQLPNTNPSSP